MSDKHEAYSDDPGIMEMVSMLMQWHENRINQLNLILSNPDYELQIKGKNDEIVTLDGDIARGFKAGIEVAVEMFSPFPLEVSNVEEE